MKMSKTRKIASNQEAIFVEKGCFLTDLEYKIVLF